MDAFEDVSVVIDERDLTRPASERDVRAANDAEFDENLHAKVLLNTTATSEGQARVLLDLVEASLTRLVGGGEDVRLDIDVLTHQDRDVAHVRLGADAVERATASLGIGGLSNAKLEDFVVSRLVAEYEMLLMRFNDTSHISHPKLIVVCNSGRTLLAERARSYF